MIRAIGEDDLTSRRIVVKTQQWYCHDCKKFLPGDVACDYDWSGTCMAGDYSFLRDHPPVRSGAQEIVESIEALRKLQKSLPRFPRITIWL